VYDLCEGGLETHLEESVGFIENNVLDTFHIQVHFNDEMQESPRCCNNAAGQL